jgi:hypothetical protein
VAESQGWLAFLVPDGSVATTFGAQAAEQAEAMRALRDDAGPSR